MQCSEDGITLIVVPYWWDQTIESLVHTIHAMRPDISLPRSLMKTGSDIPMQVPTKKHFQGRNVEMMSFVALLSKRSLKFLHFQNCIGHIKRTGVP